MLTTSPSVRLVATVLLVLGAHLGSSVHPIFAGGPDDEPERDNFLSKVEPAASIVSLEEDYDPFSGQMQLRLTPVVLKGKGSLDLRVSIYYSTEIWNRTDQGLHTHSASIDTTDHLGGAGWQLHMGKVFNPNGTGSANPSAPDNPLLVMPDGSTRLLFQHATEPHLVSEDRWTYEVDATIPGWRVTDTNGIQYEFTTQGDVGAVSARNVLIAQATRILDLHGNEILITYTTGGGFSGLIDTITETYGRTVEFEYWPSTGRVRYARVKNGATVLQTWEFKYTAAPLVTWTHTHLMRSVYGLVEIVPPEGDSWLFEYYPSTTALASGRFHLDSVTFPTGGTIDYTYAGESFEVGCQSVLPIEKPALATRITGGRAIVPGTWTYSYTDPGEDGATTTVSGPDGYSEAHVLDGFVGYIGTDTTLFEVGRPESRSTSVGGQTVLEEYAWEEGDTLSNNFRLSSIWDNCGSGRQLSPVKFTKPVTVTRTVTRGLDEWETVQSDFDSFGNPETISETGNSGLTRDTNIEYWYSTTKNILSGRVTLRDEDPGNLERHWYDVNGLRERSNINPSSPTQVDGINTTFAYDSSGRLVEHFTDNVPANRETDFLNYSFGFPEIDRVAKDTGALDIKRDITPLGLVAWQQDGRQAVNYQTDFDYDDLGRLISIDPADGFSTGIDYEDNGEKVTVTRGTGTDEYVTEYHFDGFGRLTKYKDVERDDERTVTYNALGRKVQEQSTVGGLIADRKDFDLLGRIVQVLHSDDSALTYTYDGSEVTVTNEVDATTILTYEAFGDPADRRLKSVTDALDNDWDYSYHSSYGLLDGIQTPLSGGNGDRSFTYNSDRLLTEENHPESGDTDYQYSAGGDRTRIDTEAESWVDLHYDRAGWLEKIDPQGQPTHDVDFEYNDAGLPIEIDNAFATVEMDWDGAQRLIERDTTTGGTTYTIDFDHAGHDWLEEITYPSGRVVTYVYSTNGRVEEILAGDEETPYVSLITYKAHGGIDTITFGNGMAVTYDYDSRYRVDDIDTPHTDLAVVYDAAGRITSWTTAGLARSFGYDELDRLTSATGPFGESIGYTYDALGNRETRTVDGVVATFTNDAATQRLSSVSGGIQDTFGYDGSGRLTSRTGATFAYTPHDRLASATINGTTETYSYDGDGQRISRSVGGETTIYIRDGSGNVLAEYDGAGQLVVEHVYLGGRRVASVRPPSAARGTETRLYVLQDVLGSTWILTDDSGALVRTHDHYWPFGLDESFPQSPVQTESRTHQALSAAATLGPDIIFQDGFETGCEVVWSTYTPSPFCGDQLVFTPEVCDGNCLAGETCESQGFDDGVLACQPNCLAFDTSGCSDCGNGTIEPPEVCDTGNLDGESCQSQGFDAGTLACLGDCSGFDTSGCYFVDQAPLYAGQYLDDHTGFLYLGARYHEPLLGRLNRPDPGVLIPERPQGLNRYTYALNSPFKYDDPNGEVVDLIVRNDADGRSSNFGHVALRVYGVGYDSTYDFGRYRGGGVTGRGILRVWANFESFRRRQLQSGDLRRITIAATEAEDRAVMQFFQDLIDAGRPLGPRGDAFEHEINRYHLFSNNCTTICVEALESVETFSTESEALEGQYNPLSLFDDVESLFEDMDSVIVRDIEQIERDDN